MLFMRILECKIPHTMLALFDRRGDIAHNTRGKVKLVDVRWKKNTTSIPSAVQIPRPFLLALQRAAITFSGWLSRFG